jgi:hypothetical protein
MNVEMGRHDLLLPVELTGLPQKSWCQIELRMVVVVGE